MQRMVNSIKVPGITLAMGFGLFLILCLSAKADSWMPIQAYERLSENQKFVAKFKPNKEQTSGTLIVSSINQSKTNEIWRTKLRDMNCPGDLVVADDGSSVITVDNWGRIGYGENVVCIYNKRGSVANYSLEQIAPPDKTPRISSLQYYWDKFPHSTSSRYWHQNAVHFFVSEPELKFCLWLDWKETWVVWRLSNGLMETADKTRAEELNTKAREHILGQIKAGKAEREHLNFLCRLHVAEDRQHLESWLTSDDFYTGFDYDHYTDAKILPLMIESRSSKREVAETMLARWNGKQPPERWSFRLEKYDNLGSIEGIINLPTAPKRNQGSLRAYLIPESIPLNEWSSNTNHQYLVADFGRDFPFTFTKSHRSRLREPKLPKSIDFGIYGVTPGNYRLKIVWDKAKPIAPAKQIIYLPEAGDYESTTSPVFTIEKGKVLQLEAIACDQLVKN